MNISAEKTSLSGGSCLPSPDSGFKRFGMVPIGYLSVFKQRLRIMGLELLEKNTKPHGGK